MGMTFDPDVIAAGKQALDDFGSGTTGSRVLNGTYPGHKAVRGGAQATSTRWTMRWSSRPATRPISGSSRRIAGKDDYIVLDIDSHASIYDGCALGNAQIVPFRHNDVEALEKRLKRIPEGAGKLVVLEGVYSMLGDVAPLEGDGRGRRRRPARWCWSTRRIRWASSASNGRGVAEAQGVHRRGRLHHRHLLQERSARSAASASPTIPSSRSCGWSAGPTCSPPRCRRAWSPPPRPRSAS